MNDYSSARSLNILVGVWLILSGFCWSHSAAQLTNALVVGAACALSAIAALRIPPARFVNAVLGMWLFVSTWMFPANNAATLWNHTLTALVMLVIALVPSANTPAYRH